MKTSKILMMAVVAALALSTSSCKKKTEETVTNPTTTTEDTETTSASDNDFVENTDADIDAMGSQASENGSLSTFRTSSDLSTSSIETAPCATVTTAQSVKIFTVDFGTTGCVGADGKTRTGQLIYDFSGSTNGALFYRNPGFKYTVTSNNYVVDGYSVTINNKTVANTTPTNIPTGTNPGTNLTWSISANVSIVKPNNGGTISWTATRTRELVNTADSICYRGQSKAINWARAHVKLNGTASGTRANNETFSSTATDLVRWFDCSPWSLHPHFHPFISGTLTFTPGNRPTRVINYGSGACDDQATLTISGHTYTFALH